jgi:hypothetical protein
VALALRLPWPVLTLARAVLAAARASLLFVGRITEDMRVECGVRGRCGEGVGDGARGAPVAADLVVRCAERRAGTAAAGRGVVREAVQALRGRTGLEGTSLCAYADARRSSSHAARVRTLRGVVGGPAEQRMCMTGFSNIGLASVIARLHLNQHSFADILTILDLEGCKSSGAAHGQRFQPPFPPT